MYHIARQFGGELNLVVWRIDQPIAKLKSTNIKLSILDISRCGLWSVAAVLSDLRLYACAEGGRHVMHCIDYSS